MILVLLGTQKNDFTRLLEAVQKNIDSGLIKDKVIVQAGDTKFKSKDMEIFDLIPMDKMNDLIDSAKLIITHGGVGSIVGALKKNKKIIVMPRLSKYGEHVNNHQQQIVSIFEEKGYIKSINSADDLTKVLSEINEFTPNFYQSNTNNIIEILTKFINEN